MMLLTVKVYACACRKEATGASISYMHIYMYEYTYIHTYMNAHTHTRTHTHTCTHITRSDGRVRVWDLRQQALLFDVRSHDTYFGDGSVLVHPPPTPPNNHTHTHMHAYMHTYRQTDIHAY